jgi:hypothetical protein
MKCSSLVVLSLLLAPSLFADAGRIIPAGALVSCTTGDGRINSKTTAIGDPVLCKVEHQRGDFMLPYGSYLGGEFAEYKDPGHFVGKGWMELSFDRLYVGNTVVPLDAKVVNVPGYKIDAQGRILGKGHAVRDTVLWMIPVLWPIDLINLPRRGPRPTLKAETALTLRVMEDIQVPDTPEPQRDPYGLYQRPNASAPEPPPPTQAPDAGPENAYAAPEQYAPPAEVPPPPPAVAYAAPVPYPAPIYAPPVYAAPYVGVYGYGGIAIGVRPGYYAYGRGYYGGPAVRAYAPPRVAAPAVRSYGGYGYAARGPVAAGGYGYASRGPVAGGYGARGFSGGSMMASRGAVGGFGGGRR